MVAQQEKGFAEARLERAAKLIARDRPSLAVVTVTETSGVPAFSTEVG